MSIGVKLLLLLQICCNCSLKRNTKKSFCISWCTGARGTLEYVLKIEFADSEIIYGLVLDQSSRSPGSIMG